MPGLVVAGDDGEGVRLRELITYPLPTTYERTASPSGRREMTDTEVNKRLCELLGLPWDDREEQK